ncbi:MAG TPA: hypothetical protein VHP58_04640 [Alphaproteobacteria bacterium]|nr:hypothetical protein [Alphaproteobacteria bacterium]
MSTQQEFDQSSAVINALCRHFGNAPTSKPFTGEPPGKLLCFAQEPEPGKRPPRRLNDFEDQVRSNERPVYPPGRQDDRGDRL